MLGKLRRFTTAALIAPFALVAVPTAAQASADICAGSATNAASCIAITGTKLKVTKIRSRVDLQGSSCANGHSQVLINGAHYADSAGGQDQNYCSGSWGGAEVTTGTWNINRTFTNGTKICSKFWVVTGVRKWKALPTACATVRR